MKWARLTKISLAIIILGVTAGVLFAPAECLTIRSEGRLLRAWPIKAGETFEITFTHSLNLSPITDVIERMGNALVLRKSIFKTFGAGVPVLSDGIGRELIHNADGSYELIGIDKAMESVLIMTQDIPNHRVTFKGREVFLLEEAGSGKQVEIKLEKIWGLFRHE